MSPSPHFWRPPALPFFEGRRATGSLSCYAPHTHDSFSIGVVDAGHSIFTLADRSEPIFPGDVILVQAGDVHSCNPADLQRWSYRMFHLDTNWLAALLAQTPATCGLLARMPSQVVRSPEALQWLDRMTHALEHGHPDLQSEVIRCLQQVMRACADACAPAQHGDAPEDDGLQRAHDYLLAHCRDRVSLATLAELAGTSRYQVIRQFRRRFGLTPHALQLDMRIRQARTLLQRGASTVHAALDTGFADQSHFHRAFKSRVAATPLQYRRA